MMSSQQSYSITKISEDDRRYFDEIACEYLREGETVHGIRNGFVVLVHNVCDSLNGNVTPFDHPEGALITEFGADDEKELREIIQDYYLQQKRQNRRAIINAFLKVLIDRKEIYDIAGDIEL